MALTGDIYKFIDTIAPFKNQEEWDNSGFLVGDEQQAVTKAMVVLDITSDVVDEAIISGARMIISHHPIIFSPIKAVTAQTQPIVYKLVKHGISAVCAHTSLDVAKNGVNDVLAKALGLKNIKGLKTTSTSEYCKVVVFVPKRYAEDVKKAMTEAGAGNYGEYTDCTFEVAGKGSFMPGEKARPFIGKSGKIKEVKELRIEMICPKSKLSAVISAMKAKHPYEVPAFDIFVTHALKENTSLGRVGELEREMSPDAFAARVKQSIGASSVRFVKGAGAIKTVAICGGSGGSLMAAAKAAGAQALVTGDVKHDQFIDAKNTAFTLVDAGHYATEVLAMSALRESLAERFADTEFILGTASKETVNYI